MRKKQSDFISVVVPAYKKEKVIKRDLQGISKELSKYNYKFEVICVVDGCIDKTFKKAKEVKDRHVKVYTYEKNMGKGYAVRYGMAKSKGNIVAFLDAGLEIPPKSLVMALQHFYWYGADIVIGSKRHPVSMLKYPMGRKVFSYGYQMMARILFGLKVKDTQVGVKIFKRRVLKKILPKLLVKRYAMDIEMLAVANYFGYTKIFEAPVEIHYRFDDLTHASTFDSIVRMLWDTLAVFYRLRILYYYDKGIKSKYAN